MLFQKNFALPPPIEEVGFPDFSWRNIVLDFQNIWIKILIFTQISRNDPYMRPKSRLSCFFHSGFPGEICKIASGIPDLFLYGGRAQLIWNSPMSVQCKSIRLRDVSFQMIAWIQTFMKSRFLQFCLCTASFWMCLT